MVFCEQHSASRQPRHADNFPGYDLPHLGYFGDADHQGLSDFRGELRGTCRS